MNKLPFNINDKVKLKLTAYGTSILKEQHDVLKLDEDGMWEEQLWVIMHKLGPAIYNGSKQVIESNIIIIPVSNRE